MSGAQSFDDGEPQFVGQVLCDRWRVVRRLGKGGMSTVYEAADDGGARVALKILNASLARKPRTRERFLREGKVANAIQHPNAVRVLGEHVTADGALLLVMELLEGQTLRERCRRGGGTLDLAEVLRIGDGVLEVLEAAHARGILHRDIKPENVFLTTTEEIKVLDFGIAAVRDEVLRDADMTQSGVALGTPAFMAPEQARGRSSQLDARTDVWAVGATMFYCLTGKYVHDEASTANEAMIFAATQPAPALARFCPELAPAALAVVDRALALDVRDRWQTASEMRGAIALARRPAGPTERAVSVSPEVRPVETLDDARLKSAWRPAIASAVWPVAAALAIGGILVGVRSKAPSSSFGSSTDTDHATVVTASTARAFPTPSVAAAPEGQTRAGPLTVNVPPPAASRAGSVAPSATAPSHAGNRPRPAVPARVSGHLSAGGDRGRAGSADPDPIPEAILDRRK